MSNKTTLKKCSGIFLVWKQYQRRPEVLASLLNSELKFIAHLFRSRYLRPIDYLIKLLVSVREILNKKPDFVVVQCPPTYSALPALITNKPYIIDAHNPLFQVEMWQTLPLSQTIVKNALAIIVHNAEMFQLVRKTYPSTKLFTISDPIRQISFAEPPQRQAKQILVIASFDPWDEPVDLLIDTITKLTEYQFIITADITKLDPETAASLQKLANVSLTGFLATEEYHRVLCTSLAALVLTTSDATQPSGACEALSSDTQLVISDTSLTKKLFGEWAVLVNNSSDLIGNAIRSLSVQELDLSSYRHQWNISVELETSRLIGFIEENSSKNHLEEIIEEKL